MSLTLDDAFPSKWLRASDLGSHRVDVTIESVEMEHFQDGTSKPAMRFVGKDKGMVVNRTNATTIAGAYGQDMLKWIGKPIELFSMKVQGPSGLVDGIRVMVPQATAPAAAAREPEKPVGVGAVNPDDLDDDIPF